MNLDERLEAAVAARDRLAAEAQRLAGRKEAAEKAVRDLEVEIREKKLDPDTLDDTVEQLEAAYRSAVETLEREVEAAQKALSPYLENPS
jgi:chromosome segregation ATPase